MRVDTGARVRLQVANEIRRSPVALPVTSLIGTIRGISPETLWVQTATSPRDVAIPRIVLQRVEVSLGPPSRWESMKHLTYIGAVLGLLVPIEEGWLRLRLMAAGAGAGAFVGLVRPYERWEQAWIPLSPGAR
jgi:hypothetical protein